MKKLFTLILMALAIVTGAKAQATEDIDITSWGWNYHATSSYADGVMTIKLSEDWGQGSTGWNSGTDWSRYNKLTVVIESYNNDYGKVYFKNTSDATIAEQTFSTISSQTSVTVNFDPTQATSVKQVAIQGKASGDVIKVSRVYLTEAIEYEETGTAIEYDKWGNILASEFEGYEDNAKVVFTYTTTGELTNESGSIVGWGTGSITSLGDNSIKVADVPIKALGENTLTFTLGELRTALEAGPDEYNRYGLYWNMYPQGNSTSTRTSVMIYKAKTTTSPSFSAVTISSTLSGTNENIPVVANGEALFADLSNQATNDFVINSITITPVGSFQRVQGQFRLTSEDGNTQIEPKSGGFETVPFTYDSTDDVWKAEDLKLEVAGGQELDANTNYILEFYFEGSTDGNTYNYTYKNGENNFKVKFKNGTPALQFKAENTATMTLNVDGTATTINFNKDGSVYNGNNDLGKVSVLRITGFTTTVISSVAASSNLQCWITTADGSARTQEQGGMHTANVTTSGDEQSFTATVTNTDIISITAAGIGLTDGKTYILHGYFQVMDNDGNYYFAPNKDRGESFAIQFTYKETPTGINGISTDEADENEEIYNIAGQKVGKNYKGLVIKNGKKQIVK